MAKQKADVTLVFAADGVDEVTRAANAVANQMNKTAASTTKAAGAMKQQFRFMRGGMGQLGYQIQDVAVQLQMGQNAMIVFGQQGSQIASLFGPQGALIGAILAVGAAVGTSLLPSLFKTSEAIKAVDEDMKDLVSRYDELSDAAKSLARIQAADEIKKLQEEIAEEQESIDNNTLALERNQSATGRNKKTKDNLAKAQERLNGEIQTSTARIGLLNDEIDALNKATDGTSDVTAKLISSLEDERREYLMTQKQIALLKAEKAGATDEDLNRISILYDEIEALEKNAEMQEDAAKRIAKAYKDAAKQAEKDQELQMKSYKRIFDTFGDGFARAITESEKFSEGIKAMSKSVIDSLLRLLVQKYIVDAAFGAFTNFIGGLGSSSMPTSSTTPGLNVSNIGSQSSAVLSPVTGRAMSMPTFAGGGFTGRGSRSGGVDGRGGFNAILHPNETVIDHENGSMSGVVVNQTINISTGVSQTVRAEIVNLMPQISAAAKSAVADGRARGGSFGKALGA